MTCCRFKSCYGRLLCLISFGTISGGFICTMIGVSILPSGLPPNNGSVYISPPDSNYANDYNAYMMQSFGYYLITRIGLPIFGVGALGYVYMYRGGFIYDDNEEAPVNRRVRIAPEHVVIRVTREPPVAPAAVAPAAAAPAAVAHVAPAAAAAAPAAVAHVAPAPAAAPKPTSVGVNHNPSSANHNPPTHNTYELRPLPDMRYEENMRRYKQWLGHQPLTFSQNAQFYKQTA